MAVRKMALNSQHSVCLERRMKTWQEGDLCDLLLEGRTIQQRIPKPTHESHSKHQECFARSFTSLMFEGKTKAAIRLLTDDTKGGVLRLSDKVDSNHTVRDVLSEKHPPRLHY